MSDATAICCAGWYLRELGAAGSSGARIRVLTRRGDLYRAGRVYAVGWRARELLARADGQQLLDLAAAVAVRGPGTVVSHESGYPAQPGGWAGGAAPTGTDLAELAGMAR